jgi:tripartite-type tricarboxylate transporter receptor subunit TctC
MNTNRTSSRLSVSNPRTGRRLMLAGGLALGFGLGLSANSALAQSAASYPNKPIRLVVPFTPGGTTDILARTIGQKLTEAWGQPVVIDNVPGAGGSIGSERVAKAAPDGYTLMMGHIGTLAVTPSIYTKLPYDAEKSFAPVAWVANVPNVLAVHPSVPAKNLQEFVAYARANPGKVNYGSGGNGSAAHIATEYFKLASSTFMVHVPYRGTAPAVNDAVAGQIQLLFTGAPAVLPMVRSGKLKALAVSSSKRLESAPDLPTVAEADAKMFKGFEADQWYGVVAPAGTPADIVAKLNATINASLSSPEMSARLRTEGAIAMPSTPEAFGKQISTELARWKPVVSRAGIKPE